jgi:hypothetical protein
MCRGGFQTRPFFLECVAWSDAVSPAQRQEGIMKSQISNPRFFSSAGCPAHVFSHGQDLYSVC